MGLRKDFLTHKRKTIESFGLVRADISSINNHTGHLRNIIDSLESRISKLDNQVLELRKAIDKNSAEISLQHNSNLNIQSKIENINKSVSNIFTTINSFKNNISKLISNSQQSLKDITINKNAIKKLFALSKNQSLKNKQLNSELRKSQEEFEKLRNFLNIKLKTVKRSNLELESRFKSQKRRMLALNRKIEGKKAIRIKSAKKRIKPRKIIKKTITPKKIVTETITPKRKTITEVKK